MDAAFLFEPDGYLIDGPKLMGRQSAGNGQGGSRWSASNGRGGRRRPR